MAEPPGELETANISGETLIPTVPNSPEKSEPASSIALPTSEVFLKHEALSELDEILATLQKEPHSPKLWRRAVDMAEADANTDKIEQVYVALLKVYPNTPAAQIAYIDHFLADPKTFNKAEELFRTYLRNSPSVELCRFYLTYVRRVNSDPGLRDAIRMSYEFALNHIGQDKDSGDIWADYIQFLTSDPSGSTSGSSSNAPTTWEAQQRMDSIRKAYHRAVQIPLENVQKLWEEWESFETNLNKITAKKFLSDLSPSHIEARQVLRELKSHYSQLGLTPYPPLPGDRPPLYLPAIPTFTPQERALLGKWKQYLKWEEGNPLKIDDKDRSVFIQRVTGVYRKALGRMRFYPEIWFMAYCFLESVSKNDDAIALLKSGIEANPQSFLLNLKLCEALEQKAMVEPGSRDFSKVHTAHENFISVLRKALQDAEAEAEGEDPDVFQAAAGESQSSNNSQESSPPSSQEKEKEKKPLSPVQRLRREFSLAYIMYMRFGRRTEGQKGSRGVFAKARKEGTVVAKKENGEEKISKKRGGVGWEVYEAAALLEYHTSEERQVPARIFEKGLEFHGDEIAYVERYLGYLISVNDEKNARALFERIIASPHFKPEETRPIWARWLKYECQYGTLEASLKLEKRMEELFPKDTPTKRFALRHSYLDIDAVASVDLGMRFWTPHISPSNTQNSIQAQTSIVLPQKRASSPEHRGKDRERDGHKRQRALSPPRDRRALSPPGRDHRRREDGERRTWDRDRSPRRRFSPPPPSTSWEKDRRRDDDNTQKTTIPSVLKDFIGRLPAAALFDGPVFRTDDLMALFRNAVIPSVTPRVRSPPPVPPPRSGGRPPPDYGPYQGPGGSRSRRY